MVEVSNKELAGILLLHEKLATIVLQALKQVDCGELTPKAGLAKVKEVSSEIKEYIGQSETRKVVWHCMLLLCDEACTHLTSKMS